MTAKEIAIKLVTELESIVDEGDIYWNATEDAKRLSIKAIDIITDNNDFWQNVKKEIELLPEYIQNLNEE